MKYDFKNNFHCTFFIAVVFCAVVVASQAGDSCVQEELLRCAYPLRVLTAGNKDLGFVAKKEELDELCPSLKAGLHCIDAYTRRCMTDVKRDHFNRLYSGTSLVIQELCREGPYQQEFLRHAPCMRLVKSDYEDCATHYTKMIQDVNTPGRYNGSSPQEASDLQMQTVCCSFQDYIHCSEQMVMKQCGTETARFTQSFLDRMSSSLIKDHCRSYLPSCMDAISGAFSSSEVLLSNWLLLLLVNFALLVNAFKST